MTSKTISTTVHGYKFAASNTNLTITATGTVVGNGDFGLAAIYGASRAERARPLSTSARSPAQTTTMA